MTYGDFQLVPVCEELNMYCEMARHQLGAVDAALTPGPA